MLNNGILYLIKGEVKKAKAIAMRVQKQNLNLLAALLAVEF
jgi:hypothetical protein